MSISSHRAIALVLVSIYFGDGPRYLGKFFVVGNLTEKTQKMSYRDTEDRPQTFSQQALASRAVMFTRQPFDRSLFSDVTTLILRKIYAVSQDAYEVPAGFEVVRGRGGVPRLRYAKNYRPPRLLADVDLVRHGETDGNLREVLQGVANDAEHQLNDRGRSQAEDAAEKMVQDMLPQLLNAPEEVVLLASPSGRAQETCRIFINLVRVRLGVNLSVKETPLAGEINFGKWERLTVPEIGRVYGQAEMQRMLEYRRSNPTVILGGAESFLDVIRRSQKLIALINRDYAGKRVIIFSHGTQSGALRAVMGDRSLLDAEGNLYWRKRMPNATPFPIHRRGPADARGIWAPLETWPAAEYAYGGHAQHIDEPREQLPLTDADGQLTGEVKSRKEIHRDGDWHRTSHVYVFDSKGRIVLARRSEEKDISGGKLQFFGGHAGVGESEEVAAARETSEELGLSSLDPARLIRISDINEIRRTSVIHGKKGVTNNNERSTVYMYQLTPEEEAQALKGYNTRESDYLVRIPFDELPAWIKARPDEFSGTLNLMALEKQHLFDRMTEGLHTTSRSLRTAA